MENTIWSSDDDIFTSSPNLLDTITTYDEKILYLASLAMTVKWTQPFSSSSPSLTTDTYAPQIDLVTNKDINRHDLSHPTNRNDNNHPNYINYQMGRTNPPYMGLVRLEDEQSGISSESESFEQTMHPWHDNIGNTLSSVNSVADLLLPLQDIQQSCKHHVSTFIGPLSQTLTQPNNPCSENLPNPSYQQQCNPESLKLSQIAMNYNSYLAPQIKQLCQSHDRLIFRRNMLHQQILLSQADTDQLKQVNIVHKLERCNKLLKTTLFFIDMFQNLSLDQAFQPS